jgi:hypothetical protein
MTPTARSVIMVVLFALVTERPFLEVWIKVDALSVECALAAGLDS